MQSNSHVVGYCVLNVCVYMFVVDLTCFLMQAMFFKPFHPLKTQK